MTQIFAITLLIIVAVFMFSVMLVYMHHWTTLFVIYGVVFFMDIFLFHGKLNVWLYVIPPLTLHVLGLRVKINNALTPPDEHLGNQAENDQRDEGENNFILQLPREIEIDEENHMEDLPHEVVNIDWSLILRREFRNPIKTGYSIVSFILLFNYYLGGA